MRDVEKFYDVAIVGGGPAGLSVGSELSKLGHRVLVIEKGRIGDTNRSWIIPGSIIKKLDADVQKYAYNGVRRFLEYTPDMEIKWDSVAPWDSEERWKCYPYIDQRGILTHWAKVIRESGCHVVENCAYIDYAINDGKVILKAVSSEDGNCHRDYEARLLIDASGYSSEIVKKNRIDRKDYFWWSVYGYDIEFDDIETLKHPGSLGNMKVGDYMLWQSFKDVPMDTESTLSQLRPIMEYEVLDEKRIFVFILYYCKNIVEKDYMKNQFNYILREEESIKAFQQGKLIKERFGWYPSNGLSQRIARDRVAFIGDAGCWTIPAGWGMSFILNNYKIYAENIGKALKKDELDQNTLNKCTLFNQRRKYEIVMDKVVLHFLAFAKPQIIDRFTKCVIDAFGGGRLETMFCLQMNERESIETLKVVLKEFNLKELFPIIKDENDYLLLLDVAKEFVESGIVDKVRKFLGIEEESAGFEFEK